MSICEPSNYDVVTLTVQRTGRGSYRVVAAHRHEGAKSYCPNSELYDDLSWGETEDVALVILEGRRPGMHPDGWEQQPLW